MDTRCPKIMSTLWKRKRKKRGKRDKQKISIRIEHNTTKQRERKKDLTSKDVGKKRERNIERKEEGDGGREKEKEGDRVRERVTKRQNFRFEKQIKEKERNIQ